MPRCGTCISTGPGSALMPVLNGPALPDLFHTYSFSQKERPCLRRHPGALVSGNDTSRELAKRHL
jgi:hypothetical protein